MKKSGRARAHRATGRRSQAERSEQMRRRLIDATITCLAKDGYVKTTIRRIAGRAKVSHGAAGHHFPNKAALIAAAAEELVRCIRQMQSATLAGLPPDTKPKQSIRTSGGSVADGRMLKEGADE